MHRNPRRSGSATSAPPPDVSDRDRIQEDCNRVLDAFMDALNAYDAAGMDRCMHFPHPRIADGSVIGVYESLYILTKVDGRWGIQARSSFGP